MQKDIIPIFACCSIALLLGGWSFFFCYFIPRKARFLLYLLAIGVTLFDVWMIGAFGLGIWLFMICIVTAICGFIIGIALPTYEERGHGVYINNLFGVNFVASHFPFMVVLMCSRIQPLEKVMMLFEERPLSYLLLFAAVPLSSFLLLLPENIRLRPGIDTHFPDAGNN
jgi:hypothetical protein